jgi:hypothetical protein
MKTWQPISDIEQNNEQKPFLGFYSLLFALDAEETR